MEAKTYKIDDKRLDRIVALMINLTAFLALVTYFGSV